MLEKEVGYGNMSGKEASVGQRKVTKQKQYSTLVAKLIEKNLSSLEHKWIVRIILQKIEIGIGFRSIFGYIDPYAQELYDSFNNLKELCKRLSDPVYKKTVSAYERTIYPRDAGLQSGALLAAVNNTSRNSANYISYVIFKNLSRNIFDQNCSTAQKVCRGTTSGVSSKNKLCVAAPCIHLRD
mmetsp:Transcript_8765/g.18397  ORF Transcript_8765/g.18397 Transcript_8765/m.18397 type:complete len:183 (-) Transcript_8765:89-637(-)